MLPDREQCKLLIFDGNLAPRFSILEGAFKRMRSTRIKRDHPPQPEVSQTRSEPVREPDEKEPEEKEACDFTILEEWTFKNWCKNSLAQAGLPPKPEVSQTQSESDEE